MLAVLRKRDAATINAHLTKCGLKVIQTEFHKCYCICELFPECFRGVMEVIMDGRIREYFNIMKKYLRIMKECTICISNPVDNPTIIFVFSKFKLKNAYIFKLHSGDKTFNVVVGQRHYDEVREVHTDIKPLFLCEV